MHPHEGPRHYLPVQFSDVLGEKKKNTTVCEAFAFVPAKMPLSAEQDLD